MVVFTEGKPRGASEPDFTTVLGLSGLVCAALRRTLGESVGSGWKLEVTTVSSDGADGGVARGAEALRLVSALAGVVLSEVAPEDMGVSHLPISAVPATVLVITFWAKNVVATATWASGAAEDERRCQLGE